jgi:hypothetical protein
MAGDTWSTVAVPLLEHVAAHEAEYAHRTSAIGLDEIAATTGLDAAAADLELKRLFDGGYLDGRYEHEYPAEASWLLVPTLSERGARAAGVWPSSDPAEAMLAIIERKLDAARTAEERSFWQKIKDGFAGVPGSVTGSLAAEVAKAVGGLGL